MPDTTNIMRVRSFRLPSRTTVNLKTLAIAAVVAVTAALLTALVGFDKPAEAHFDGSDSLPLHMAENFRCYTDGTVQAKPPYMVGSYYGGLENVRWKVDLYRWNGSNWGTPIRTTDLYQAGVNKYGLMTENNLTGGAIWRNMRTGFMINNQYATWGGLPRGHYTIMHRYHWVEAGVRHSEQGFYGNGYKYCTI